MRGRRPRPLAIPAADTPILEAVARSRSPAPADCFHRTGSSNRHPAALRSRPGRRGTSMDELAIR